MADKVKALVLGDLIGHSGMRALFVTLHTLIKKYDADIVILNGENADDGFGITPDIANKLFAMGVDVITSGNHIWQKRAIFPLLEKDPRILRPANYPKGVPGKGFSIVQKKGIKFGVLNLIGRVSLAQVDCPFSVAKKIINEQKKNCDLFLVDFHAESVNEKEALAFFLDGEICALWGTHTHVQTADERILPKGTAYMSDIGMIGPYYSVIGSDPQISIRRMMSQLPLKSQVLDSEAIICGASIEIDIKEKRATNIIPCAIKE